MNRAIGIGLVLAAGSVAIAPVAAVAAAPTAIAPGAIVKHTSGSEVGKIQSVDGGYVILRTDRHQVRLPASSFTPAQGFLRFAMTREQLNADVERQLAQADDQIVPGALVRGQAGSPVGTITAVDADSVTLKLTSDKLVKLPRSGVGPGPQGPIIGLTAAELEAKTATP
jgi:hypothetical protein